MVTKRQQLIKRYERIKAKWDASPRLKQLLPERYKAICQKLEALRNNEPVIIRDVTVECVVALGALLCSAQLGYDNKHPFAYWPRYQKGLRRLEVGYARGTQEPLLW